MLSDETTRAALWTSEDGLVWSEPTLLAPEPAQTEGIWSRHWISGFGQWGDDLLAFGWNGVGGGDGGYPMLWRSADGVTWALVETGGSKYVDDHHFPQRSIVAPGGELAVLSGTGLGNGASMFLTSDLVAWEAYPITPADRNIQVTGVAASEELAIAVGTETHPWVDEPETSAHAWVSKDGRRWTSVETPNPDGALTSVAWDDVHHRFVVVGSDDGGLPAAWLTSDGRSWSQIALGDEEGEVSVVVSDAGLTVAAGVIGSYFDTEGAPTIAWSSFDALNWWYVPIAEDRLRPAIGITGRSVVTLMNGWTEDEGDYWVARAGSAGSD
jgi:hypothetical protein